jgi:hypothetical protein
MRSRNKLGETQRDVLHMLRDFSYWRRDNLCHWNWGTPSSTERILLTLVKRKLVRRNNKGVYTPEKEGMKRRFRIKGIPFVVTYDDDSIIDTIERNGKPIASDHRDARSILNNAERIWRGVLPDGWRWDREKTT